MAGSKPTLLASIGSVQPMALATTTTAAMVSETAILTAMLTPSNINSLAKFTAPRARPHNRPTRTSYHITLIISFISISPRAIPRIIRVEACEPEFPPVPVRMVI